MLNLAGFGLRAWDPASHDPDRAFAYYSQGLPVFDRNLKNLAEKIRAGCLLAHVRGVAYHTRVEISLQNCHPFHFEDVPLVMAHNGDLARFAEMKPLLAPHLKPGIASRRSTAPPTASGSTPCSSPSSPTRHDHPSADELGKAVERTLDDHPRCAQEARHRASAPRSTSSSPTARQLAAVRYCFDFGCFPTEDAARAARSQPAATSRSGTPPAATTACTTASGR